MEDLKAALPSKIADRSARLPAVDGLRGALALIVLAYHLTRPLGLTFLYAPANYAVGGFFVLSGYVLTRSWDGRFGLFLARRFLRLWPVYALCLAAGYAIAHVDPVWSQFLWFPIIGADAKPEIDPPIWSLRLEAWAMLFMPFFIWSGSGGWRRAALALFAAFVAGRFYVAFGYGEFFVFGAFLSRWDFTNRWLESAGPQWLGRISYSLYLSHWLVFALARREFGDIGLIGSVPVAFLVGWMIWRWVERPSIQLSRRVGRLSAAARDRSAMGQPAEARRVAAGMQP